jgi:hypothetical protein
MQKSFIKNQVLLEVLLKLLKNQRRIEEPALKVLLEEELQYIQVLAARVVLYLELVKVY